MVGGRGVMVGGGGVMVGGRGRMVGGKCRMVGRRYRTEDSRGIRYILYCILYVMRVDVL
jgi:hypothetical protein